MFAFSQYKRLNTGAQPQHARSEKKLRSLTESFDVFAVLEHVDGDVVVVDAFSGRVDAGEPGAAGAAEEVGHVRGAVRAVTERAVGAVAGRAVLRDHAGARATVSAVVALKGK